MKKLLIALAILLSVGGFSYSLSIPTLDGDMLIARRGCCSHHGGVQGCNEYGRTTCRDGSVSPSCRC